MGSFGDFKEKLYIKLRRTLFLENIDLKMSKHNSLQIDDYLQRNLYDHPRYQGADKLNRFEFQAFSQFGEDGIIQEIFKRIGVTNRYFVEFGVETGVETNTTYLLYQNWTGCWIDGNANHTANIKKNFSNKIAQKELTVLTSFIDADNIEALFKEGNVPESFDLLSIDIDRNDYYIWEAIINYKPRVVVIEYNSIFRPGCRFVVNYDGDATWDGTSNTSSSLDALYELGKLKGYKLVASSFAGVNAFFVREDLADIHFTGPFTPEHHHESPKYFLYHTPGHPRKVVL